MGTQLVYAGDSNMGCQICWCCKLWQDALSLDIYLASILVVSWYIARLNVGMFSHQPDLLRHQPALQMPDGAVFYWGRQGGAAARNNDSGGGTRCSETVQQPQPGGPSRGC